jgi:hypothetical protein
MSKSTILATARITAADDIITVTYVEPADSPPVIFVRWPREPSIATPNRLPALANAVMGVLGEAVGKLAAIRTGE